MTLQPPPSVFHETVFYNFFNINGSNYSNFYPNMQPLVQLLLQQ